MVSLTILNRLAGCGTPSTMRFPPKNQCRECSSWTDPCRKLHVRGIAPDVVAEQCEIVVEILLVEREAHLLVDAFERGAALGEHGHGVHLLGEASVVNVARARRTRTPSRSWTMDAKAILASSEMGAEVLSWKRRERSRRVTFSEAAVAADADCVRGPRRLKREAGANLGDGARRGGGLGELIGLERLAEEPLEVVISSSVSGEVTSTLKHCSVVMESMTPPTAGLAFAARRRRRLIGEEGTAEQLKHGAGAGGGAVGGRVGRHRAVGTAARRGARALRADASAGGGRMCRED